MSFAQTELDHLGAAIGRFFVAPLAGCTKTSNHHLETHHG